MMTLFTEHWVMISMITFTLTLSDFKLAIFFNLSEKYFFDNYQCIVITLMLE